MKQIKTARTRKKIFIIEDHPLTRRGIVELLNAEPDLKVCGEADNAAHAVETMKSLKPDLALVDITLPGKSGLALVKDLRLWIPQLYILVLSMHDEDLYAERVLRAGGHGYLMKCEGGEKLLRAVRHVLAGKIFINTSVSNRIVEAFAGRRRLFADTPFGSLTDREFEIFQFLGQGLPSAQIARQLHLSSKTVDSHRLHIKEKLRIRNLPELMRYAVRWAATEEMI